LKYKLYRLYFYKEMIFMILPEDSLRSILNAQDIMEGSGFSWQITAAKICNEWWA
jgi:hypothetical protein